jgi:hypothetical protein
MFSLSLHLASNAVTAYIIQTKPGYGSDFKIWEYTVFTTTRPRFGWVLASFLATISKPIATEDGIFIYRPWLAPFLGAFISEVILMLPAGYYIGWSVHFAIGYGFYSAYSIQIGFLGLSFEQMMYGAALCWIVCSSLLFPLSLWICAKMIMPNPGVPRNTEVVAMQGRKKVSVRFQCSTIIFAYS